MNSKRDVVFPAERHALYELHRYSPAIRSNGFLFVSGQVGSRKDGSPEPSGRWQPTTGAKRPTRR